MVITVLHVLHVPGALVWGWFMGALVRKRRLAGCEAYALALAPGVLIAVVSWLVRRGAAAHNEQPWQGLVVWAAWSALGLLEGSRFRQRAKRLITLGLNDRQ